MKPATRRSHTWIGLILLLPLLGWASTGVVFLVKPGYSGAYDLLELKTYPLTERGEWTADPSWEEVRYLRTILGAHLLVRSAHEWHQVDRRTGAVIPPPKSSEVARLIADAITEKRERYGEVTIVTGLEARTTTDVVVKLDWNQMRLSQRGPDTERIDWLYKIHYLQWTGVAAVDRVFAVVCILLLFALSGLGVALWLRV